jgi:proline racemase
MRSSRVISAIDTHTEGMPTRVVTGGVGVLPGATANERRLHAIKHLDGLRRFLMNEPRGHAAMSGAVLQPSTRPDADWGVATALVESGMVTVTEPVTTIRLDAPAGLVVARVAVTDGHADSVTIENVPAFAERLDARVEVPGYGPIRYSLAFGGNYYAMVDLDEVGLPFDRDRQRDILQAGLAIMAAINEQDPPHHPEIDGVDYCHHVEFVAPESTARHSRHAMAIYPGWFDRSPCGTGTSARMAELWARGQLPLDTDFINESFIGSRFTGRLIAPAEVGGRDAVVPTITGRAWVTGLGQYLLDPADPFPEGFVF